jgi:hypothetical protein
MGKRTKKKFFDEPLASVREGGAILRGSRSKEAILPRGPS